MNLQLKIRDYCRIKVLLIALLFVFSTGSVAQITTGDNQPKEKKEKVAKPEKVKTEWNEDSLSGTNFYVNGIGMWSARNFEDLTASGKWGERINEKSTYRGGFDAGIVVPFSDFISMDLGLSYFAGGESYAFQDSLTDSTYSYLRRYLQVGVPIKLRITFGQKIQPYLFAGLTPLNILQIRYDADYTSELGKFTDLDEQKIRNDFNSFNVMATGGVGVRYNFKYVGINYAVQYQRHLMNTYDQNKVNVNHKMYGVAMRLGIYARF